MSDWRQLARHYARKYGFPEYVFERQMGQEAHGEDLTSPAGAQGPAQIMPDTAAGWGVKNVHDIRQAYDAAAKHMADYAKQYGVKGALVAYNAGPAAVGGHLPSETQNYLKTIMGGYDPNAAAGAPPAASLGESPGSSPSAPTVNPVDAIIKQYRDATAPTPPIGQKPIYDPAQSAKDIQTTVAKIQAIKAPTQQAVQVGDATGSPVASDPHAPLALKQIMEEADQVESQHLPYVWGGGHGGKSAGLDCSGAVSRILGIDPRVAADFEKWGDSGPGKNVTIYANAGHVLMEINGKFFGTSHSNPEGGPGWIDRDALPASYLKNFVRRHPKGL